MKKLFSVLLALVMVFSLAVPAFAAGPAPDGYDNGYNTNWAKETWAAACAEYPEETALFLKELPAWFAKNYPEESFAAYCENYNSTEEVYLVLYVYWSYEYEQQQAKRDFITSHGGVPDRINVMLNGKYVKFRDAVPQIKKGRTMVPFRAIFEAMGAKVTYSNNKVRATLGDTQLELTIGSKVLTRTRDGKTDTLKMDCAPYIKGGRTYVPVRFISKALGYNVQWDNDYRSVVITDLDALAEQIDRDFTVYNKLAARNVLTDEARKSVGSGKADITLFDSLNGDKTAKATCSYDLTASTAGASGKAEYDLSELWTLIEDYISMPLDNSYAQDEGYAPAEDYTQALELVKSLMKGSAQIRLDLENEKVYLSMPGLFEAMNRYMEESGVQLPKDAWLSVPLSDGTTPDLTAMLGQTTTVGKLLTNMGSSGGCTVKTYDSILEAAEAFGKLYGDARFTRKGNADVLTFTKEDLVALMEENGYTAQDLDALSKFDLTLTAYDNGDADMSYQVRVALADSELNLGDAMDMSASSSTRSGRTESTAELHIKNVLKATITLQETVTTAGAAPETQPPEGATVIDSTQTLNG